MKMDVSYTDHSHIIGKGGNTIRRHNHALITFFLLNYYFLIINLVLMKLFVHFEENTWRVNV